MNTLDNKWIIYDGNCGLCLNSKKWLTRFGIIPEKKCRNYYELDEGSKAKIDINHFSYEMALVDDQSNKTMYGLEGIIYVLGTKFRWILFIKPEGLLFKVLDFIYHTISYNRYFFFPRKMAFKCDCEPPLVWKYFLSWVFFGLGIATGLSTLFGVILASHLHQTIRESVFSTLLIVGSGWFIQILLAAIILPYGQLVDYLRHLFLIMVVGVLILIPSIMLSSLPTLPFAIITWINILTSSSVMLRMHYKRVKFMKLNQCWTLSWFLLLQMAASGWAYYFDFILR